jgi:hypothetical protein
LDREKHLWSPELQEHVSQEWNDLIADVQNSVWQDPGSEKAQDLAVRWKKLVEGFTGGDPDITASVGRMWQDRENWPEDINRKGAGDQGPRSGASSTKRWPWPKPVPDLR